MNIIYRDIKYETIKSKYAKHLGNKGRGCSNIQENSLIILLNGKKKYVNVIPFMKPLFYITQSNQTE